MSRDARTIQADLDEARAKRDRIGADLQALAGGGVDAMSRGELIRSERLSAGLDKANAETAQLEEELGDAIRGAQRSRRKDELRELVRSGRGALENGDGAAPPYEIDRVRRNTDGGDVMRSQGLRMVEELNRRDEIGRSLSPAQLDQLDAMIRRDAPKFDGSYIAERLMLTENDAYRAAFQKYIASGVTNQPMILSAEEAGAVDEFRRFEARRSASENVTTAGGFGVPVLVDSTVLLTAGAAAAPLLRVCRVEQITTNLWTGVSSAPMQWSYRTEGTEATDNMPTLGQPTVRVHMAQGFLPYTVEVGQDYPGFATEMGRLVDQGYSDLLATKTMTGSGTNEPFGLFVALSNATSVITPTTDGTFGGPDVFKVWNALPERFRPNAQWVMSVNVQSAIRQFAASQSSTSAYFSIDLTGGTFRINDRPVIITDYAPTGVGGSVPGTTGLQNILAVADFEQSYLWVQRAGMSIENVPVLFGASNRFPSGQRGLWGWARNGGNVVVQNGGRMLQNQ